MRTIAAAPFRTGAKRLIPPWEYRHLRACGGMRMGAGILLEFFGVVTFSLGGNDAKTYGWTAVWMLSGALTLSLGYWEMTVASSR